MPNINSVSFTDPYQIDAERIRRQQALAMQLQQQSGEELPLGQMAGGYFVPTSPLSHLARALKGGMARGEMERGDRELKALGERQGAERQSTLAQALRAMQGTPGSSETIMDEQAAGGAGQQAQINAPAVAPNPREGMNILAGSRDPMLQQVGMQEMIAQMKPKELKAYKPGDVLYKGENRVGAIPAAPKFQSVGGNLVQEPTGPIPEGGIKPVYTAPQKPDELTAALTAAGIDPKSPEAQALFRSRASKLATHQPAATQTVINRQETEEAKKVGGAMGEDFVKIQSAGRDAIGKIARYDRMAQLLDGVETGKLTPLGTDLAAYAKSIGFKVDEKLSNKQAAAALSAEMALQLRNPSGGAGMPGALSDKDREFLQTMTPGLSQTPGGNKLIIETAKKLAKRDQEVARLAREYRAKNGTMTPGFYEELQKYSDQNPLFGNGDDGWTPL